MIATLLAAALAQDPAYETTTLEAGRRADRVLTHDLDGDGHPDLLVQDGRDLHLFLYEKGRGFAPKPRQTLRLDGQVFAWTLGALDGYARPTLFTAGSRALQAHPFDGRAFAAQGADLVVHPSIFEGQSADGKPPLFLHFAPDLDGDGRSDLLLFLRDEILVMKQRSGSDFRCLQKLPIPVEVATVLNWGPQQKVTEVSSLPLLAFGDVNGDRRTDISYYRDEAIGVFAQLEGGTFRSEENLDLTTEKRKRRDRFLKFEIPPRVDDFNNDGLLDLAVSYPSRGRVHVYYGGVGRHDFTQPDDLLKVADGWSTGLYLEDLDGDGKKDLVMGVIRKFGLTQGISVFLSGRVDIELHVYPMRADNRFSKDPVQELRFSIPYSFHLTRDSASLDLVFRPNFKGDFNRDGLRDLVVTESGAALRIYPGVRDRGISDKPGGAIKMAAPPGTLSTEPIVEDFNRDGVSDLVLKHSLVDPIRHVLELKLSR